MIFTITTQCRSNGMITPSVVRLYGHKGTLWKNKNLGIISYTYKITSFKDNEQTIRVNAEQIEKDKYPDSKTVWRINLNNEWTQQNKNCLVSKTND